MTKDAQEKAITNAKPADNASSDKEKVRAADDVIAYAETHELQGVKAASPQKPEKPEKKPEMIRGVDRFTGKEVEVELSKVKSLARYIYVHSLSDPTPVIEAVVYKAILPGTTHVTIEIDESTFEDLRQLSRFKGRVHYNYVDDMAKNNPKTGAFYHRTFHVLYPEWIRPEDVAKQAKQIISHYGIPDLSGIAKVLWPQFDVEKTSLGDPDLVLVNDVEDAEEADIPVDEEPLS